MNPGWMTVLSTLLSWCSIIGRQLHILAEKHQSKIVVKVCLNEPWVDDGVEHPPVLVLHHLILLLCVPLPTPHYHSAGIYRVHTVPSSQDHPSRYQASSTLVLSDQLCSSVWVG